MTYGELSHKDQCWNKHFFCKYLDSEVDEQLERLICDHEKFYIDFDTICHLLQMVPNLLNLQSQALLDII